MRPHKISFHQLLALVALTCFSIIGAYKPATAQIENMSPKIDYVPPTDAQSEYYVNLMKNADSIRAKKEAKLSGELESLSTGNYEYKRDIYWKPFEDKDTKNYFNGEFSKTTGGDHLSRFFLTFIDRYSVSCAKEDDPKITNIQLGKKSIRYENGRKVNETPLEGNRILVRQKYADTYARLYNDFYDLNTPNRVVTTAAALQEYFSGGGITPPSRVIHYQSVTNDINRLFEREHCKSAALSQMIENLYRAANNLQSVQTENKPRDISKDDAILIAEELDSYGTIMTYTYASAPPFWLPDDPTTLLKQTYEKIGKFPSSRQHIMASARVIVHNPHANSLKEMNVRTLADISHTNFERAAYNIESYDRAITKNADLRIGLRSDFNMMRTWATQAVFVECIYEDDSYLIFWHKERPVSANLERLRSVYERHPYLIIDAPQTHCPKSYSSEAKSWYDLLPEKQSK